ncbi:unnamed protein product, partial [Mesorhabditis belari]|uniref:Transmembrane protein n=1 Tax=Mesorhabditis belari TaxID=2138241 RepID=A0AAF3EUF9_9BILA
MHNVINERRVIFTIFSLIFFCLPRCATHLLHPTIRQATAEDLDEDYLTFEMTLPPTTAWPKFRPEMRNLEFSALSEESLKRSDGGEKRSLFSSALSPCAVPQPGDGEFEDFCQMQYHQSQAVCDPGSLLSRTESELLDSRIEAMNMSGCICKNCADNGKPTVAVVVVSLADWNGFQKCLPTGLTSPGNPIAKPSAAFIFSNILADHWAQSCRPDLFLVYIERWTAEPTHRPYLIPIYQNDFHRLASRARPVLVRATNQLLDETTKALINSRNLMNSGVHQFQLRATIPSWAVSLTLALVGFMCVAIYVANYITTKIGRQRVRKKSSVSSVRSHRLRPGVGGGLMMTENRLVTPVRKSTMMFRSFNKSRYAAIPTANRI